MSEKVKKILPFLVVIFLSYWTIKPMLIKGYFPMHDDTQPARVFAIAEELKRGIFPVRLVGTLGYGYGYPLFNFYAPLPYYLGAVFYLSGFDLISATKIMFAVGCLLSGLFMYMLAAYLGGPIMGFLASLFYLYAPFHAVNIYVRGAVGEYYAYAILPLLCLGILKIFTKDRSYLFTGSLALAAILLSHNILGLITLYFLSLLFTVFLILFFYKKISGSKFFSLVKIIILGICLSAFFILPAILEKDFTRVNTLTTGGSSFSNHFVVLSQLWDSPWGFGGSAKGLSDGLSFKIGKFHLLTALAAVLFSIYLTVKKKKIQKIFIMQSAGVLIFIISVFMMLSQSSFFYQNLPFLNFVQYPWRFLNFAVFSVSLLIVSLCLIKKPIRILLVLSLSAAVVLINQKYFNVEYIYSLSGAEYLSSKDNLFRVSKISDEYLPWNLTVPVYQTEVKKALFDSEFIKYRVIQNATVYKSANLQIEKPVQAVSNTAFIPGWQVKLDGKNIPYSSQNGFIKFNLPMGPHKLELSFKNTPVRTVSNSISFLAFILLIYLQVISSNLWPKKNRSK